MSGAAGPGRLSPEELAGRLDRILGVATLLVARIPDERMGWRPPGGGAALGDLAFQLFRLGLAFADGLDMGRYADGWRAEAAPADLTEGAAVARYGALVRARLGGWFEGAGPGEYARQIAGRDGTWSGHELLAGTVAEAASRLRGLHAVLDGLGVRDLVPLPAADLEGLDDPAP
jgi:hypothetical protein